MSRGNPVKGHPGISKRLTADGSPRYDATFRGPDGREHSKTFRTRDSAVRWRRQQMSSLDRGSWIEPRAGDVSLAAFVETWSSNLATLAPTTRRLHETNIRLHILPVLGGYRLRQLSSSVCSAWLADTMSKGDGRPAMARAGKLVSPATARQAFATLRLILNDAVRAGLLQSSPLDGVRQPRILRRELTMLTPEQIVELAEAISPRYRAFVYTAAYCGLRLGEMAALSSDRVDFGRSRIDVREQLQELPGLGVVRRPTKTGAGRRSVPIPRFVGAVLSAHFEQWVRAGPDAFVFTSPEGGPLRANSFRSRAFVPAAKTVGLPNLRIHDLRHVAASFAIRAGADVKTLQTMLGHSSPAVTLSIYAHLLPDALDDVADRIDVLARRSMPHQP